MQETYKPDPKAVILEKWELECGDLGTRVITGKQMQALLKAEQAGAKLVMFDDFVINVAFIRGATKRVESKTQKQLQFSPVSREDEKFVVLDNREKLLA